MAVKIESKAAKAEQQQDARLLKSLKRAATAHLSHDDLTSTQRHALIRLAIWTADGPTEIDHKALAAEMGCSRETAGSAVKRLVELGLVKRTLGQNVYTYKLTE
jgi:DNA-binding MarR family transcriptional regulator